MLVTPRVHWQAGFSVAIARLVSVGPLGVHLRCTDGFEEFWPTTRCSDLAVLLDGLTVVEG